MAKKIVETTVYSLSADTPQCPDRRSDQRYVSLLRVGALVVDGRRELCLIRNVSAGGMMIRPYSPIAVGTQVSIELKHGDTVSGVAQWADKGLIGVTFDEAIDVLALLNATGLETRPRMPRIEIDCTATIRHEGTVFRARVVNISQGGICIDSPVDMVINGDVVVTLAGLHAAAGVVKWRDGETFGIGFNRVYPVHELMTFLQTQQQEERQKVA
ncbi:MAG TPA: PilZ domain-containing protein [Sphingomicrobium sp.]|nr:PilZ domain-containing protein [Sphingomicrobium sp.]